MFRRFLIGDIINFDYDGKTYTGYVNDLTTIAQGPNGPFSKYIVVSSVFNDKIKTVKIHLTHNSLKKYNVQLRYRHGQEEKFEVSNSDFQVIE